LCPDCRENIVFIERPICIRCGAPLDPGTKGPEECRECRERKRSYVDRFRGAGIYEGVLQKAVLNFKFDGRRSLARPLAELLAGVIESGLTGEAAFDFVCPVPLHPQRLKERGFNQSELLAKYFCEKTGSELRRGILVRTRPTIPQVMLPAGKRRTNVRGAFALGDGAEVKDARVLLIDDVYTTGATLQECARMLKKGGASAVSVLTVALPKPKWMTAEPASGA